MESLSDLSVLAGLRLVDEWDSAVARLDAFPAIGHRHVLIPANFLVLGVGKYLAVYRLVDDSAQIVRFVRADANLIDLDFEDWS